MRLQKTSKMLALTLAIFTLFSVMCVGCAAKDGDTDVWENAIYTEDKTFGNGSKSVAVEVIAADKSITFTLKTDKENLADALLEHSLVEGEDGQYGLYIKKVNGILADYDVNGYYWSLSKDGEYAMKGISETAIAHGEHYELTYSK